MKSNPSSIFDSKARDLFVQALQEPRTERSSFVKLQAKGDAELEQLVLGLLQASEERMRDTFNANVDEGSGAHNTATFELLQKLVVSAPLDTVRYKVADQIGRGGMGAVMSVRDAYLNRELAMKVMLQRGTVRSAEDRQFAHQMLGRFLEEAQVTSQLDHPGVVPVHELGVDAEGKVFFTMRLVRGQTLRDVFGKVARGEEGWNRQRALEVVLKVCDTIAYAHSKGVLHRDLKPANIMVGRFGEVYVMDWGLAKVIGREDRHDLRIRKESDAPSEDPTLSSKAGLHTARNEDADTLEAASVVSMDGQQLGTPTYMAPEQARSEQLDERVDVYAIGAILYTMLRGEAPYTAPGNNAYRILDKVLAGPPESLDKTTKGVPAELVAIVERAMARNRLARYPSVAALGDDLRAYLDTRVVSAYRTGAIAEMKMWVRRNTALATSIAAAVVCSLGGLTIAVWKNHEANQALKQAEESLKNETKAKEEANQSLEKANLATKRADAATETAKAEATRAQAAETEANSAAAAVKVTNGKLEAELRRFYQLKSSLDSRRAKEAEANLYRAGSDKVARMEAWLKDAGRLFAEEAKFIDAREELRRSATPDPVAEADRRATVATLRERRSEISARLVRLQGASAAMSGSEAGPAPQLPPDLQRGDKKDEDWLQQLNRVGDKAVRRVSGPSASLADADETLLAISKQLLAITTGKGTKDTYYRTLARRMEVWAIAAAGRRDAAMKALDALAVETAALRQAATKSNPDNKKQAETLAAEVEREVPFWQQLIPVRAGLLSVDVDRLQAELATLERELAANENSSLRFGDGVASGGDQILFEQLDALVRFQLPELRAIAKRVERELRFAKQADELASKPPPEWQARWDAVARDLQNNERYGSATAGVSAASLPGLVPIGDSPNRETKLWEFYDLRSAWDGDAQVASIVIPQSGAEVLPNTGVVFVLVPAGAVRRRQEKGGSEDKASIEPFLLAKHELTQGQWARLWLRDPAKKRPSSIKAGDYSEWTNESGQVQRRICTDANPVDSVSWWDCMALLTDHGWEFPSALQWRYAALAAPAGEWINTAGAVDLGNFADLSHDGNPESKERWDDGHQMHAPVGKFRPNPWGLFDMLGNVNEWSLDAGDRGKRLLLGSSFDQKFEPNASYEYYMTAEKALAVFQDTENSAFQSRGLRVARKLQ